MNGRAQHLPEPTLPPYICTQNGSNQAHAEDNISEKKRMNVLRIEIMASVTESNNIHEKSTRI